MTTNIVGQGWPFPLKRAPGANLALTGGPQKVEQSIWIILSTAPGERQMLPDFGCGVHDLVFQPNSATLRGLVQARIQEALTRWEPRIDVLDVRVDTPPESRNFLMIHIDYRLRANNSFYNLVYPLYLREGVLTQGAL